MSMNQNFIKDTGSIKQVLKKKSNFNTIVACSITVTKFYYYNNHKKLFFVFIKICILDINLTQLLAADIENILMPEIY